MSESKAKKNYIKKNIQALKNKVFIISAIIFFVLLMVIFNTLSKPHTRQLQAKNGYLDLSSWDFEKDGVVSLDGEWEFYWNQLLTYKDFEQGKSIKPDGYFEVPSVWTNYTLNDEKLPAYGYATYRLKVKADNIESLKGLKILTFSTAYKLMVNDEVMAENGVVGQTKENAVSEFRPKAVSFKNTSKNFDIIIQISNYKYSRGGMWHSIYLGNDQQIRALKEFDSGKAMFMFGVTMIMSLYHMTLFLLQKRDKSSLYFALILLVTAIRISITGEYIINNFVQSISITRMVPVEYMTMYWGLIMTIAFVHELYPKEVSEKIMKIAIRIGLLISIFTISVPIDVFTKYLIFYEILIVCMYAYIVISVFKAVRKKRDGALLLLLSAIIVLIAFISDVLYYWNVIFDKYGPSMEIAVFIVTFIEAYILAARFSLAFEKVEKLSEKLISLDKLKDEFLANTSHELKTPLKGIINITESLLKGVAGKLNFNQEDNLQIVLASSRRLYNLINDILDISSLKYNQMKLNLESLNVNMVVEAVIFVLEYLKGEKDIIFENNIPKDLPAVFCDEERLGQIFYNLLENAIKFTEKGYIRVNAKYTYNEVIIFVEDTGIGIKEDNLDSIFNCFGKANASENNNFEGIGAGLSITKSLIELQGGKIGVRSQYGKGTCFFFTLPIAKEKPENNIDKIKSPFKLEQLEAKDISIEKDQDKYNILVVEHDVMNFKALINNLSLYNYTVKGVKKGKDALKLINNGVKFDVIILNIMMPDISGYEILKKIRGKYLPVELPVLLLTSRKHIEDISAGFKLGANDYLSKPFEPEELNARVNSLINMKKAVNSVVASELSFLQAQIKPHFIYNALSVISSLSLIEPSKAKELILDLSDYLRGSFDFESKEGLTTLKRELNLVKAYLAIEQARFKERLCVEFDIKEISCTIPMLSIQPLVENAVRHGIMPMISGGKIWISVKEEDKYIKICVRDNGVGIDEERLNNILSGKVENGSVGIKNIHRRLIKLYGRGIKVSRGKENGTKVEFNIPYGISRGR